MLVLSQLLYCFSSPVFFVVVKVGPFGHDSTGGAVFICPAGWAGAIQIRVSERFTLALRVVFGGVSGRPGFCRGFENRFRRGREHPAIGPQTEVRNIARTPHPF